MKLVCVKLSVFQKIPAVIITLPVFDEVDDDNKMTIMMKTTKIAAETGAEIITVVLLTWTSS